MLFITLALFLLVSLSSGFTNPLRTTDGSDPFMVYVGGYYYFLTTTWTDIEMTRATTLEGLKTATPKTILKDTTASRSAHVWAPEVWYIDDTWYIYYTAGHDADLDLQRPYVLKGGTDIWNDNYSFLGQLSDEWGIDGTIMFFDSPWKSNYFVWSCQSESKQSLCIAPLTSPSTLGATSVISRPTESWETVGATVNEGPAGLYHGGKTFLTYSASYCWTPSYQLGLLTWNGADDPTLMSSWTKTGPVFSSANGNYGTGHNGFFTSPDGTETWMVFGASSDSDGACDGTRYTEAEIVNWNSDGSPNFGKAPALSTALTAPSGE